MDDIDKRILRELQRDANLSAAEVGERVGLTSMPVWRRIQRLGALGLIRGKVTLLDRDALGYQIVAFMMLRTSQHDPDWFGRLSGFVEREQAVVEFHRMSGQIDFMLKVLLRDMEDYRDFYKRLIEAVELLDVSTSFAFETLKETTELPL